MIIECHSKDFMVNKDFTMCTVKQCHEFACAHCAFFSSLWCTSSFSPQLFYKPNSKLCRFLLVCNLQHQKHRPMMIDQSLSYLIREHSPPQQFSKLNVQPDQHVSQMRSVEYLNQGIGIS